MIDQKEEVRVAGIIRKTCYYQCGYNGDFYRDSPEITVCGGDRSMDRYGRERMSTRGNRRERNERDRDRERSYRIRTFYRSSLRRYIKKNIDRKRNYGKITSYKSSSERYNHNYK